LPLNGDILGRYVPEGKAAVWRTRDAGAHWQAMREGLPQKNAFIGALRQAMATDRLEPAGDHKQNVTRDGLFCGRQCAESAVRRNSPIGRLAEHGRTLPQTDRYSPSANDRIAARRSQTSSLLAAGHSLDAYQHHARMSTWLKLNDTLHCTAADRGKPQMSNPYNEKDRVDLASHHASNVSKRGIIMLLFLFCFGIAQWVLYAVAVIQFLWMLIRGERNAFLATFGRSLGLWLAETAWFLSGDTEERPFPWRAWPQD
jgi:hypothetical protein